jgi:hypothetical protein
MKDGEGEMEQCGKVSVWAWKVSVWAWKVFLKTLFSLLISTQSVAFSYNDSLAMQAHVLNRTRYFYSLNVIISHPTVQGFGYPSVCAFASWSSPPSHVWICNGQWSSELFCVHCTSYYFSVLHLLFLFILCLWLQWMSEKRSSHINILFVQTVEKYQCLCLYKLSEYSKRDVPENAWTNVVSFAGVIYQKQAVILSSSLDINTTEKRVPAR